jgi:hypothetical protein
MSESTLAGHLTLESSLRALFTVRCASDDTTEPRNRFEPGAPPVEGRQHAEDEAVENADARDEPALVEVEAVVVACDLLRLLNFWDVDAEDSTDERDEAAVSGMDNVATVVGAVNDDANDDDDDDEGGGGGGGITVVDDEDGDGRAWGRWWD